MLLVILPPYEHIATLKRCGYRLNRLPLIFYMYSINDSVSCAKLIIMIYSLCIEFKMIERMAFGTWIASTKQLGSTNPFMTTWREIDVWFFNNLFISLPELVMFWFLKRTFHNYIYSYWIIKYHEHTFHVQLYIRWRYWNFSKTNYERGKFNYFI